MEATFAAVCRHSADISREVYRKVNWLAAYSEQDRDRLEKLLSEGGDFMHDGMQLYTCNAETGFVTGCCWALE